MPVLAGADGSVWVLWGQWRAGGSRHPAMAARRRPSYHPDARTDHGWWLDCFTRRGAQMFLKLRVPLLGLIENMAYHRCGKCGHVEHIFGTGGVERAAADYGMDVIGQVRVRVCVCVCGDTCVW